MAQTRIGIGYKANLELLSAEIRDRSPNISAKLVAEAAICYGCRREVYRQDRCIEVSREAPRGKSRYYFHVDCYLELSPRKAESA